MCIKENNIVYLEEKIQFRFIQEVFKTVKVLGNGRTKLKENVLIMLERKQGESIRTKVHPISEFLMQPLKKGGLPKVASLKAKASYVVKFLNNILIENNKLFKANDIADLRIEHGVEFLNNYGSSGVKKETVKACENVLKEFYYFLCKKNVLKYVNLDDFELALDDNVNFYRRDLYVKSPFFGVDYPSEECDNVLHFLPQELVIVFLDTAITHTPEIALGVYFQFFGGLRIGEVVNISKSAISLKGPFGKYGIVVKLENRKFRDELKDYNSGGAVKRFRRQAIYPYKGGLLEKLYKNHINTYIASDVSNALFVNKDGKAMADFTYRYYFSKLKSKFLERLRNSNNPVLKNYAIDLQSRKWSTHLGRGVFTYMLAEVARNITQISVARGDKSLDASLTYLNESSKMAQELYQNQIDMWDMLLKDLTQVDLKMGDKYIWQRL